MIELPNADTLQEKDLLEAVKKIIRAQKEQSEHLQNLFYSGDTKIAKEMVGLREDINALGQEISDDLDKQTQTLQGEIQGLRGDLKENTEILKMIAENTKKAETS